MTDLAWWFGHALVDRHSVRRFEEDIRSRVGVRHVVLVSTGRAALTLALTALKTLDQGRRDEVVIPSYTCFSVASSVVKAGLKIRLVDVDPRTLDFSPDALDRLDGSRVLAIVATNLYGLPNDLPRITRIAADLGAFVVDDAAQCLGGSVDGRPSGAWGHVGIFSLDKGKNITSIDGGVIVTDSDDVAGALAERTRSLRPSSLRRSLVRAAKLVAYAMMLPPRFYWMPNALPFLKLGITAYRTDYPLEQYDAWLAPMGRRLFGKLDEISAQRVANAEWLRKELPWNSRLQAILPGSQAVPVYLRFPVLVDPGYRDAVTAGLCAKGIGATASYPSAICDIPGIQNHLRDPKQSFSGGRSVARQILTLPTHPYVAPRDRACIVATLREMLGRPEARGINRSVGAHGPCAVVPKPEDQAT